MVQIKVSLGELVDKISILMIKQKKITDQQKLTFINDELKTLKETLDELNLDGIQKFLDELITVNEQLWDIEDDIRDKERQKKFDEEFIELARKVYVTNDQRFSIKNNCNTSYGSQLREVKSYQKY